MNRREFLTLGALGLSGAMSGGCKLTRHHNLVAVAPDAHAHERYFLQIYSGFLRNARATAADLVVCDFPDGTKLKSCCTPSGKTYVAVARMLPAMAEWYAVHPSATGMRDVCLSIYRNAFDPNNPNFWGYAPSTKATQLSVEAALVAWSLWRMGDDFVKELTPEQRTNIQKWLASCTQVVERKTNHAWFTATNQATRLELSRKFPEFQGDEAWMIEDLKALDALGARTTEEGWFSDSPDQPIYDIYAFYVFPNFPLMWGQIIGARYPQWKQSFYSRVKTFLKTAPYFFAANGSHPHMGRSLIYRWCVLAPLVMGYREGLWPHSVGLLKRIVRKNLEYHWSMGCYDGQRGKLREQFSDNETPVTREPYIDNGHPYWTMLGFAFLGLPEDDPFWTAKEELLPVEKSDYVLPFAGPKFLVTGRKHSGEVRWILAQNSPKRDAYRDKYIKFTWSSHFGFCSSNDKEKVAPDQTLVFRDIKTGVCAARAPNGVTDGKLLKDGVETAWWAQLGGWKFNVVSTVRIRGDVERRTHVVTAPADAVGKVEVLEGSFSAPSLEKITLKPLEGYDRTEEQVLSGINLIYRDVKVRVAIGKLSAPQMTFAVEHSATP